MNFIRFGGFSRMISVAGPFFACPLEFTGRYFIQINFLHEAILKLIWNFENHLPIFNRKIKALVVSPRKRMGRCKGGQVPRINSFRYVLSTTRRISFSWFNYFNVGHITTVVQKFRFLFLLCVGWFRFKIWFFWIHMIKFFSSPKIKTWFEPTCASPKASARRVFFSGFFCGF